MQEAADRLGSVILVRARGHRQPGVVSQQRDDRVDVAGFNRIGELSDNFALAPGGALGLARAARWVAGCRARCGRAATKLLAAFWLVSSIFA